MDFKKLSQLGTPVSSVIKDSTDGTPKDQTITTEDYCKAIKDSLDRIYSDFDNDKISDAKEVFSAEDLISNPPAWVKDKDLWENVVIRSTYGGKNDVAIIVPLKEYKRQQVAKEKLSKEDLLEQRPKWADDEKKWETIVNRATHNGYKNVALIVPMKMYKTSKESANVDDEKNIEEMRKRAADLRVFDSNYSKFISLVNESALDSQIFAEILDAISKEGFTEGLVSSKLEGTSEEGKEAEYLSAIIDLVKSEDGVEPNYNKVTTEEASKIKVVDSVAEVLDKIYSNLTSDPANKDLFFDVYTLMSTADVSESVDKFKDLLDKYSIDKESVLWDYADDLKKANDEALAKLDEDENLEYEEELEDSVKKLRAVSGINFKKLIKLSDCQCPIEVGQKVFSLFSEGIKEIAKFGQVSGEQVEIPADEAAGVEAHIEVPVQWEGADESENVVLDSLYLSDSFRKVVDSYGGKFKNYYNSKTHEDA